MYRLIIYLLSIFFLFIYLFMLLHLISGSHLLYIGAMDLGGKGGGD